MARSSFLFGAIVVGVCASWADAGVMVEFRATAADPWVVQSNTPAVNPGYAYDLTLDRCLPGFWRVRVTDPTQESFARIRFDNTSAAITLIIGGPNDNITTPGAPLLTPGCLDWVGGLDPGSARVTVQARIGRDVGPLASISAEQIVRLDVDRDIVQSAIRHTSTDKPLSAIVASGRISDNLDDLSTAAVIYSAGGPIESITAGGAIMPAIIVAPVAPTSQQPRAGTLGQVYSATGDIGGARPDNSPPDNYRATNISARIIDGVVGRNVRADIVAAEGFRRIESTIGGMRGSITASTILPIDANTPGRIRSEASNAMRIVLTTGLPKGAHIAAGTWFGYQPIIADTAQPTITLGVPNRLGGQILLNDKAQALPLKWNSQPLPRSMMGRVVIQGSSPATIATDVYTTPSVPLGGGAVGIASFNLYATDCTPPNAQIDRLDGVVETAFANGATPVVIRNYGPVALASGIADANAAVRIERQSDSTPCVWTDASSMFSVVLHPIAPGADERRGLGLMRGATSPTPGVYRVVPTGLVCADVTGSPAVIWPTTCTGTNAQTPSYVFRVAPDCDADGVNDNAQLDALYAPPAGPILTRNTRNNGDSSTIGPITVSPEPSPIPVGPTDPPPTDPPPMDPPPKDPPPTDPPPTDPPPTDPPPSDPPPTDPPPTDPPPPPPPPPPPDPNPAPPTPPPPVLNCITVCVLDVNKDRRIDVQDLFEFLNAWFSGLPAGDYNRSGTYDVQDLFDYMNGWFTAPRTDC